jgi:hypothetical protein
MRDGEEGKGEEQNPYVSRCFTNSEFRSFALSSHFWASIRIESFTANIPYILTKNSKMSELKNPER